MTYKSKETSQLVKGLSELSLARNMKAMNELSEHLKGRAVELVRMKKEGKKVVGFFPGDFVPEELIHASGAVPVCLIHGGSTEAVEASTHAAVRLLCPFAKTTFGLWVLGQPYYRLIDLLVAPITCNHMMRTADMWYYFTDVEVFRLGIPHEHTADHCFAYYLKLLYALKERLEDLTGKKIDQEGLKGSIELYNHMRSSFKKISESRKKVPSPFEGTDFIKLNHASFYAEPEFMVRSLDAFYNEMQSRNNTLQRPEIRILLAGPNLAMGDTKIISLIENLGGKIVVEEISEGIRFYWENVSLEGNLMENIGHRYLTRRIPCAFQGQGSRERYEFHERLTREYDVKGVIWYELKYCETYDLEYHYIQHHFKKVGIPTLKLESEYDPADIWQLHPRIEAFLKMIEGREGYV